MAGQLLTGEERTLPREHCTKVTLDNLSKLQVQLQSHQLAKVSDALFRANRYLGPNESKTWNYLLNRDRQRVSSGLDLHSDFDRFVEIEKQPDNQAPVQPHLPTDSDLPTDLPGLDQNQLIQPDDTSPEKDVFNNPLDPV